MIDFNTYSLFHATALILVITPGPDTLLVVSRTMAKQVIRIMQRLAAVAFVGLAVRLALTEK